MPWNLYFTLMIYSITSLLLKLIKCRFMSQREYFILIGTTTETEVDLFVLCPFENFPLILRQHRLQAMRLYYRLTYDGQSCSGEGSLTSHSSCDGLNRKTYDLYF